MIKTKKQIVVLILTVLSFQLLMSQNWNATLHLTDDSLQIQINSMDTTERKIDLSNLTNNTISNVYLVNKRDSSKKEISASNFTFIPEVSYLNYTVNLNNETHFSKLAYLNYNSIELLNFKEFLFTTENEYQINLSVNVVEKNDTVLLGDKYIDKWKIDPFILTKNTPLVSLNNLNFYSNNNSKEFQEFITHTFKGFNYFDKDESKEVLILSANKSIKSEGVRFNDLALVYLDSSIFEQNDLHSAQKIVLNILFKWVSPYKTDPEEEGYEVDKAWLSLSTPEFLTIKYSLTNNLISEQGFFAEMETKILKAKAYSNQSLFNLSVEYYNESKNYEGLINKGTMALLLLDLKFFNKYRGKVKFYDLISGDFPQLSEEESLVLNNILFDLEENLVNTKNNLDYNKYLNYVGLKYTETTKGKILKDEAASSSKKELWKKFKEEKDIMNE